MTISGTIWYDADSDAIEDVGEVPTPNIVVTAEYPDLSRHTATSDENGEFAFDVTLAGEYRLYIASAHIPPKLTVNPDYLLVFYDGATPYDIANFALQPASLGRVDQVIALLQKRHAPIVEAYCLDDDTLEELANEALDWCELDADGGELTPEQISDVRTVLEVVAWRWVEENAALAFDFSADGLSTSRAKLFEQAERMRVRAEDKAYRFRIGKFKLPDVRFDLPPRWREPACG